MQTKPQWPAVALGLLLVKAFLFAVAAFVGWAQVHRARRGVCFRVRTCIRECIGEWGGRRCSACSRGTCSRCTWGRRRPGRAFTYSGRVFAIAYAHGRAQVRQHVARRRRGRGLGHRHCRHAARVRLPVRDGALLLSRRAVRGARDARYACRVSAPPLHVQATMRARDRLHMHMAFLYGAYSTCANRCASRDGGRYERAMMKPPVDRGGGAAGSGAGSVLSRLRQRNASTTAVVMPESSTGDNAAVGLELAAIPEHSNGGEAEVSA